MEPFDSASANRLRRTLLFCSSRRRHTIFDCDWSSDVCSSDLYSFYEKAARRQALSESLDSRRCPMSLQTVLTRRLGLQHPIIQAPLAGGGDTPDLVAAVAEAGGPRGSAAGLPTAPQTPGRGAAGPAPPRTSRPR